MDHHAVMGAVAYFVLKMNIPPRPLSLLEVRRIADSVSSIKDNPGLLKASIDGYFLSSEETETGNARPNLSQVIVDGP